MPNPWRSRRVLCYAHQGGAREFPSSTLFAIDEALAIGATAIELDVHQSSDGVLVVSHDPTVDRTTEGSGAIASLTLAELSELDNAYWFVPGENAVRDREPEAYVHRGRAPRDHRFGVATLEAVLDAYPSVLLNLDIKQTAPKVAPYEEHLASVLRAHERADDVIVTSFNDNSTARFSEFAPEIGTAPGVAALTIGLQAIRAGEKPPSSLFTKFVALQVPHVVAGSRLVDRQIVDMTHDLDLALHVWTVDEPEEMSRLVDLGVDGIMTDVPSVLSEVLSDRGVAFAVPRD